MEKEIDIFNSKEVEIFTSKELRMEDAGLTRESAYNKVLEMMNAQIMTLDKFGEEHYSPDNSTQLRATEMVLKMRGEIRPDTVIDNRVVNISGVTSESVTGLLNMVRSAADRIYSMKTNGRQTGEIIDVTAE